MPPKRAPKGKLHVLAPEVPAKTLVTDVRTKTQYSIGKQFATGGFGRIYTCTEVGKSTELVIKVEPSGNGPLFTEVNVFQRILRPEQIQEFMKQNKLKSLGVPALISTGIFDYKAEKLRYLIIPKYATSLEAIREKKTTFDVKSVIAIARCTVQSLEYVHGKNYTHADVKAANILLERPNDFSTAVLVDYGLARMSSSNEEKPDKKRAHNGTAIFTSLDAHRGYHPSYRGDLEILGYNMVYWLTGSLPWVKYEADPAKVLTEKEAFVKDLDGNLKKLLASAPSSISLISQLFSISFKNPYTKGLDFKKLYALLDSAAKNAPKSTASSSVASEDSASKSSSSRKRKSSSPLEVSIPESAQKVKRGRTARAKPAPILDESGDSGDEEDYAPPVKPSSSRRAPPKSRTTPSSAPLKPKESPSGSSTKENEAVVDEPAPSPPKSTRRTPAVRRARPVPVASVKKSVVKKEVEEEETVVSPRSPVIVPGRVRALPPPRPPPPTDLARRMRAAMKVSPVKAKTPTSVHRTRPAPTMRSPAKATPTVPADSSPEYHTPCAEISIPRNTVASTDRRTPLMRKKKTPEKIPSDIKRNPDKLKAMVPGVRSITPGRRSIIVHQIAKKYRNMARKSTSSTAKLDLSTEDE